MAQSETPQRHDPLAERPTDRWEPLPIWRNTRPRANPEVDTQDLERGIDRLEAVLGR